MNSSDLIALIITNLKRMKFRVILTALGVVIGITSMTAMISLGIGMQRSLSEQLLSFQAVTQITVVSGQFGGDPFAPTQKRAKKLDEKLIKQIKRINYVKSVFPTVYLPDIKIKLGGKSAQVFASSIDVEGKPDFKLAEGTLPHKNDDKTLVVGYNLAKSLKKSENSSEGEIELVNKRASLILKRFDKKEKEETKRIRVRIKGRASEKGDKQSDYNSIYLPVDTAASLWQWQENDPNLIRREGHNELTVTVASAEKVDEVQQKLKEMDLTVFSMKEILGQMQKAFTIIQAVLGGIGSIALLVASLGIVNTMIMSIYERTREIGILKAIGAGNKEIIKIFLGEAGAIGFIGGIGGVTLGWLTTKILNFFASLYLQEGGGQSPLNFYVPLWLVVFGIIFATFVGLFAGIYPAMRAARLSPLVALRHE